MKKRKSRLPVIVDILTHNCIGSQEELSKQLEWLETDSEGLFTEVSFEDFEKEMQAREDIAGTNCFKLDFINRIITNLNSIEKELYQEFNSDDNNLPKSEKSPKKPEKI